MKRPVHPSIVRLLAVAAVLVALFATRETLAARDEAPTITPFATAHVVIDGTISAAGQELPVQGEGDIDAARNASRLTVGLPGAAFETIVVDGRTYSRNAATGRWEYTEGGGAGGFNAARLAPYDPQTIRAAGKNFARVGSETVAGTAATRWRADADLARLIGVSGGLGPLGIASDAATMDLWIGDGDGHLLRLTIAAQGAAGPAAGTASATPTPSRLNLTLTFSNFDQPVPIVAPPGAVAATPRATPSGTAVVRASATPTFAGVAVTVAPVPNNTALAEVTSGRGTLSSTVTLRIVAACSIIGILVAVVLAARHRRQLEARRLAERDAERRV